MKLTPVGTPRRMFGTGNGPSSDTKAAAAFGGWKTPISDECGGTRSLLTSGSNRLAKRPSRPSETIIQGSLKNATLRNIIGYDGNSRLVETGAMPTEKVIVDTHQF